MPKKNSNNEPTKLTTHPAAEVFPMMEKDRFEELKADINKRGLVAPIVVMGNQILDGRHRYAACEELGIAEPWIEQYKGNDPVGEVIAHNALRRDLTDDQRVAAIAKLRGEDMAKEAKGRKLGKAAKKGEAADVLAKEAKVTQHKGRAALDVAKHAPEELEEVISGKKKLKDAAKVAKAKKPKTKKAPEPKPLEEVVKTRFIRWLDYFPVSEHRKVKKILQELIA